jgi:hypothetical protein
MVWHLEPTRPVGTRVTRLLPGRCHDALNRLPRVTPLSTRSLKKFARSDDMIITHHRDKPQWRRHRAEGHPTEKPAGVEEPVGAGPSSGLNQADWPPHRSARPTRGARLMGSDHLASAR